ncbi:hypothetical protein E1A91_D12G000700v1 [Gossypium mustelinum]|uniref:Uncharacterized protein n=1 Tax=Gossypium mustelinum TaxID=34275 RepID=A0A5D2S8K4_GOSMU|nr:hypothetical protein E1A91_D12G000700v1 [Gossypium mustelinum]
MAGPASSESEVILEILFGSEGCPSSHHFLSMEKIKLPIIYGNCIMGDGQLLIYTSWGLLGL